MDAPPDLLALLGGAPSPEVMAAARAAALRRQPALRPASPEEMDAPGAIGPAAALSPSLALAEALRTRTPNTGAYELFGGNDEDAVRARAEGINNGLGRQRAAGNLGLLTGDRVLSGFGQAQLQNAAKQEEMLAEAGQFRAGQTLKQALAAAQAKRQAAVDSESARHNRAMEGRPPSNVYLQGPGGQYFTAPSRGSGPLQPVADPATGNPLLSPKSDDIKAAEEKAATDAANKKTELESKYRTELLGLQPVKEYQLAAIGLDKVRTAAKDPSAAGDLAMIFGYMKTLDPTSTVREGEFANAQNAAGVPDRIKNAWNKALTGERLAPSQRTEFIASAEGQYRAYEERAGKLIEGYRKLAIDNGLDPSRVILEGLLVNDAAKAGAPKPSAPGLKRVPMPAGELGGAPAPAGGTVTLHWDTGGTTEVPAARAQKLAKEQPERFSLTPFPPEKIRRKKYSKSQNKTYTVDGNGNVISVEEGNTGGK